MKRKRAKGRKWDFREREREASGVTKETSENRQLEKRKQIAQSKTEREKRKEGHDT